MDLTRRTRDAVGRLYKVLPTALVAAALRPSTRRRDLEGRIDALLDALRLVPANLDVECGRDAVDRATEPLVTRGVIAVDGDRYRVRNRHILRYYARTLHHLLHDRGGSRLTH